jgi:predicted esterase
MTHSLGIIGADCTPNELDPPQSLARPGLRQVASRAFFVFAAIVIASTLSACHFAHDSVLTRKNVLPFNYDIALGPHRFHIEGYLTRSSEHGRLATLLVLNGSGERMDQCVGMSERVSTMGIHVACVSIPGFGGSSGPGRFAGPQSVEAARRALDLLAQRGDVDPNRIGVWGLGNGAVAAGLLMDSDSRPRAMILQSGAYDMVHFWPEAPLRTKLSILREVWPSKRVLLRRSVIENMPNKLDVSVLIMHGQSDRRVPVKQAVGLADALRARGAKVWTYYYPTASHDLGKRVEPELRSFLRENLLEPTGTEAAS